MKHLVLVRHGQSEWNAERRIQGQDGTGLSALGRKQAELAADWLAATYPDARLWVSDLQRCLETVAPLAERLDREPRLHAGLRERSFGQWEGRLVHEVSEAEPERFERWRHGEDVVPEVGGETSPELTTRVLAAFEEILEDLPERGLAVAVTHGGPVWHGAQAFVGIEQAVGGVANTSITELLVDPAWGRRLGAWNQTSHLPPELQSWLRPVVDEADHA